ncbi:MAG TPA: hypothetical protein ENG51_12180 [Deltaproteobacteria bacterium]|nr:hypothetical protein [Deltaproteobacteria bacterium]
MDPEESGLSYEDYIKGIPRLRPDEQLRLMEFIVSTLKKALSGKESKHSVMELEGLGSDLWNGIDAQRYVEEERESWT